MVWVGVLLQCGVCFSKPSEWPAFLRLHYINMFVTFNEWNKTWQDNFGYNNGRETWV